MPQRSKNEELRIWIESFTSDMKDLLDELDENGLCFAEDVDKAKFAFRVQVREFEDMIAKAEKYANSSSEAVADLERAGAIIVARAGDVVSNLSFEIEKTGYSGDAQLTMSGNVPALLVEISEDWAILEKLSAASTSTFPTVSFNKGVSLSLGAMADDVDVFLDLKGFASRDGGVAKFTASLTVENVGEDLFSKDELAQAFTGAILDFVANTEKLKTRYLAALDAKRAA